MNRKNDNYCKLKVERSRMVENKQCEKRKKMQCFERYQHCIEPNLSIIKF